MSNATKEQLGEIYLLFKDTPSEQVQLLLNLGILEDVRDGNPDYLQSLNRNTLRKMLDLGNILPVVPANANHISLIYDMAAAKHWKASGTEWDEPATGINLMFGCGTIFDKLGKEREVHLKIERTNVLYRKIRLSQEHAEIILEKQRLLPEDWRDYCFFFPGTMWRENLGLVEVFWWPYIYFDATPGVQKWKMGFASQYTELPGLLSGSYRIAYGFPIK